MRPEPMVTAAALVAALALMGCTVRSGSPVPASTAGIGTFGSTATPAGRLGPSMGAMGGSSPGSTGIESGTGFGVTGGYVPAGGTGGEIGLGGTAGGIGGTGGMGTTGAEAAPTPLGGR